MAKPNLVFVFGDQWRAQAMGYAGDVNAWTPHLDALERESVNFTHAVSGCPVCSPYRASLLTGQFPLTHGVFVNDVLLNPNAKSLGKTFAEAGYDTAYIGKWHLNGDGRSNYIPPERRQGFRYWKVLECTHDYNHSAYYANDSEEKRYWDGYDALAQTRDAQAYIRGRDKARPFCLVMSWEPPHDPYDSAPEEFRRLHRPEQIKLRPNVPAELEDKARNWLAGYYAHCSALDACIGMLLETLKAERLLEDTIFVFASDHGDLLGSQGGKDKQRPWDESIRVPFLVRYPALPGWKPRRLDALIDAPDIFPTLCGLCGVSAPEGVEGLDFSGHIRGKANPSDGTALLTCPHPFGQWNKPQHHAKEYRGIRTHTHTYVRAIDGPWLLYDNTQDPYQLDNLCGQSGHAALQARLEVQLVQRLRETHDEFLPGTEYLRRWNYTVDDATGTVPYAP